MTITFTEKEYEDFCKRLLDRGHRETLSEVESVIGCSLAQEDEVLNRLIKLRNYFSYLNK